MVLATWSTSHRDRLITKQVSQLCTNLDSQSPTRNSQGHVMGTCTCTMLHTEHEVYCSYTPSPSSANCMLSLGTPSTRFTEGKELRNRHEPRSSVTNFR
ncbi:uncharacterized protein HKW66_Vig0144350 [Vigna angularis]|uniref:Uncharacterized protein n=1 Tax=Phaseolus angularis TaxID=3914 RepID=A0A8T0KDK7_PHAAN|nr:uncharacterized protein HKW66_Vig0144350 [Vigna angularis]